MKTIYPFTFGALLLAATPVSAARPANLANTTWTLQVNGSLEPLTISTQGGAGAPGAAHCRAITGLYGTDQQAWCPDGHGHINQNVIFFCFFISHFLPPSCVFHEGRTERKKTILREFL